MRLLFCNIFFPPTLSVRVSIRSAITPENAETLTNVQVEVWLEWKGMMRQEGTVHRGQRETTGETRGVQEDARRIQSIRPWRAWWLVGRHKTWTPTYMWINSEEILNRETGKNKSRYMKQVQTVSIFKIWMCVHSRNKLSTFGLFFGSSGINWLASKSSTGRFQALWEANPMRMRTARAAVLALRLMVACKTLRPQDGQTQTQTQTQTLLSG
jgi:hypothetical protein